MTKRNSDNDTQRVFCHQLVILEGVDSIRERVRIIASSIRLIKSMRKPFRVVSRYRRPRALSLSLSLTLHVL